MHMLIMLINLFIAIVYKLYITYIMQLMEPFTVQADEQLVSSVNRLCGQTNIKPHKIENFSLSVEQRMRYSELSGKTKLQLLVCMYVCVCVCVCSVCVCVCVYVLYVCVG